MFFSYLIHTIRELTYYSTLSIKKTIDKLLSNWSKIRSAHNKLMLRAITLNLYALFVSSSLSKNGI